ncbi:23S rRNA (adenine(2030)-N(6))-methyltransferase RlmJ [Pacificispira sp.]|uniref:23S rRNA (adenine(2030)-N(6))-methyltransferase RlmJ n=1 Tax=Pacificispira sp. TaxID=2888761 RepID=UPI002ECBED1B|nr:23S rRNA (adenine(2030)-N(6))-methyltransferase RlmJ [Pseudomonadota bacterium]
MNYRHAFHAGNFADVHKHWILTLLLARLAAKDKPFFVLDSHAGAGFYDLAREETGRTGEAADGIGRLIDSPAVPDSFSPLLTAIRQLNPDGGLRWYPGSPWLIAHFLRPDDRLAAVEAHEGQAALLQETLREARNAKSYHRDGYDAIPSLLPPKERRGLTLIDPPYEDRDDVSRIAKAVTDGMKRFATGSVAIWYPIKTFSLGDALARELPSAERGRLRCEVWTRPPEREDAGLTGSGMILLNPIWPIDETIAEDQPILADLLAQEDGAGSRVLSF